MSTSLHGPDDQVLLVVGAYVRVGWPDGSHVLLLSDVADGLEVALFAVADLEPLDDTSPLRRNTSRAAADPVFSASIFEPAVLRPHPLESTPVAIGEQLVFRSRWDADQTSDLGIPTYSLWSLDFAEPRSMVMPQKWFTGDTWDYGYQWPTAAARDSATGYIVASGFRLPLLVLDEAGEDIIATI